MTRKKWSMSTRLKMRHLDLGQTLDCGQAFRWTRLGPDTWQGPIGDALVTLHRDGEWLEAHSVPRARDLQARVSGYLRAGDDTDRIQHHLSKDPVMARGIRSVGGLRLVKMDEWECLASYVLATFTNIQRIRGMIDRVAARYGDPITAAVSAFPTINQLSDASANDLRSLGLGYRADYLAGICEVMDDERIAEMRAMGDEDLRESLLELPGVGDKVADCVALFGFGRLSAFPIDVWVERALARLYGAEGSYRVLRGFAAERFGPYAGYAQEYLFFNERSLHGTGRCVFTRPGGSSCRTP